MSKYMTTKPKVLIVDDDEINRFYLESLLVTRFDVYTCNSVNNFYQITSAMKFDLILMDDWLHDSKDGIELTRELRKNPWYSNIPIFIFTYEGDQKVIKNALAVGATKIFDKSVHRKTIVQELKKYTQVVN